MVYLRTILIIIGVTLFVNSPLFVSYYNIRYENLLLIVLPILYIVFVFNFLKYTVRHIPVRPLFEFVPSANVALALSFLSVLIMFQQFDLASFLIGDIATVRDNYITKNVSAIEQVAPLLLIYPMVYISYLWALKRSFAWKDYATIFFLVLFGVSTGGRGFIFNIFLLYLLINPPKINSWRYIPIILLLIGLFGYITVGRFENKDTTRAALLESSCNLVFQDYLKDNTSNPEIKEVVVETVFYFGQGIPAFCNKVANLDMRFLPKSFWGLQPFIERQLIKIGLLNHDQQENYKEMLSLSDGAGFFSMSWSTGFLDIYFYEGILGAIAFFTFVAFLFFVTHCNLQSARNAKFKILTGYNLLFIMTMFLTPAFEETVVFFSYVVLFLSYTKEEKFLSRDKTAIINLLLL